MGIGTSGPRTSIRSRGTGCSSRIVSVPTLSAPPSRYSLISGLYVHQHRGWTNHSTLPEGTHTAPSLLQEAGYATKAVGKMHYTPTYSDVGFQEMELSEQDGPGRWDDD